MAQKYPFSATLLLSPPSLTNLRKSKQTRADAITACTARFPQLTNQNPLFVSAVLAWLSFFSYPSLPMSQCWAVPELYLVMSCVSSFMAVRPDALTDAIGWGLAQIRVLCWRPRTGDAFVCLIHVIDATIARLRNPIALKLDALLAFW